MNAEEIAKKKLVTHRIFTWFVLVSVATLIYFNLMTTSDMQQLLMQFPELDADTRRTIIKSYKMLISVGIVFVDIILVGPFAYIAYFGDHIKPRVGNPLNCISFFSFGLLLALWFTISLAVANWLIVSIVVKSKQIIISPTQAVIISTVAFLVWLIALTFKFYSYTREQRKELKKYAIRF